MNEQLYGQYHQTTVRALHDKGAGAGDEGNYGGSAWPSAILSSMVAAHCTSLLIAFVCFAKHQLPVY